jgi:hypothetical protein
MLKSGNISYSWAAWMQRGRPPASERANDIMLRHSNCSNLGYVNE